MQGYLDLASPSVRAVAAFAAAPPRWPPREQARHSSVVFSARVSVQERLARPCRGFAGAALVPLPDSLPDSMPDSMPDAMPDAARDLRRDSASGQTAPVAPPGESDLLASEITALHPA